MRLEMLAAKAQKSTQRLTISSAERRGRGHMLSAVFAGNMVDDLQLGTSLRPGIVQGEASAWMQPENIMHWYACNDRGQMVTALPV